MFKTGFAIFFYTKTDFILFYLLLNISE